MKIVDCFTLETETTPIPVEYLLERFRNWRKYELINSDWTQLVDAPADKNAWANYRQALRDLTAEEDFANAELPTAPTNG